MPILTARFRGAWLTKKVTDSVTGTQGAGKIAAVRSPLISFSCNPRPYFCHMPTSAMASNTMLAKNLGPKETIFLLVANLAGALAQQDDPTISFRDQVLFDRVFKIPFHHPLWIKRNSTIGIRKAVETDPTRSTSLPVFLAAPVFFSSSLSSPSLSVSWSEFLENYILRTPLGNNFLHMTKW